VYHDGQKFHWMDFTKLQMISHRKDGKSNGKSHGIFCNLKSMNPAMRTNNGR